MRRLFLALVVLAAFAGSAFAAERAETLSVTKQELKAIADLAPAVPLTLSAIFAAADQAAATPSTADVVVPAEVDMLVLRINDDGTRQIRCLNNEAAARRFLDPAQKIESPRPTE